VHYAKVNSAKFTVVDISHYKGDIDEQIEQFILKLHLLEAYLFV